ncbi:MAG: hypothetical protein IIU04_04120, partial [Bacteroidales bacterium]|nr:hypothetical protein [Bacteroidales bacterium]
EDKTDRILQSELQSLKNAIGKDKATDLQKYRKEISEMLHVEIVGRYYYQKGESEAALQYDPCMETVRTLFGQPDLKEYHNILSAK